MQTCVFHSELVVESDGPDEFGGSSLKFGEVAIGQVEVRKLRVWNHSKEEVTPQTRTPPESETRTYRTLTLTLIGGDDPSQTGSRPWAFPDSQWLEPDPKRRVHRHTGSPIPIPSDFDLVLSNMKPSPPLRFSSSHSNRLASRKILKSPPRSPISRSRSGETALFPVFG